MKINIEGYKNIEKLEYELVDNKLNVLIGISGSGKSSISGALLNEDVKFNKKINYGGEFIAKLDNPYVVNDISIFSESYIDKYLFQATRNDNIFNVLIDNEGEYVLARANLDNRLASINDIILKYQNTYNELTTTQKQLGVSLTSNNKIKATSTISKMKTSIKSLGNKKIYKKISDMDPNKARWMVQGESYIEDSICPYCGKSLNAKKEHELHLYKHVDMVNYEKINLSVEQMKYFSLSGITLTLIGLDRLEQETIEMGLALKEFERISKSIDEIYDTNFNLEKVEFNYNELMFKYFPELKPEIQKLQKHVDKLKKNISDANDNTKKILSRKINSINNLINQFGIPYAIEAEYKKSKIKSYKLYHIEDISKNQREISLSSGERKVISLIFFIMENVASNKKLIIFDDPVSSYDENRRFSIFKHILTSLKDKTVLILSHDQSFAKFAVNIQSKSIGHVDYFDNYGKINISRITGQDFSNITSYIEQRIRQSSNYMQKIINLRFFYEINRVQDVYTYLSKIVHKVDVRDWLRNKGIMEQTLIDKINERFNINLELFDENNYRNIDTSNFTLLEKILLLREKTKSTRVKDEISNHIHLNSKLAISLNPYVYSFCSNFVFKSVEETISVTYSM